MCPGETHDKLQPDAPDYAAPFDARTALTSTNTRIQSAIQKIQTFGTASNEHWQPALRANRDMAERSHVAEITSLVDLSDMPAGTRLIVRRERLHPGAQRSLFPCTLYRYWGHYSDNPDLTPVELDAHMRAHAHVEDHIKRLKESGLERFPFTKIGANRAWLQTVCMAADVVRWFQQLCCAGHRSSTLNRNGCAGRFGMPQPVSSAKPANTSSGSSMVGQPPATSSPRTSG